MGDWMAISFLAAFIGVVVFVMYCYPDERR
jgi:hypothetical protein